MASQNSINKPSTIMSLPLTTNTSTTTLGFKLQVKTPPSAGKRPSYTSCQSQNGSADEKHHVVDRRNILIGLTGVCGASTTLGNAAVGAPIKPVELGKCHSAVDENLVDGPGPVQCCPPDFSGVPIKDFSKEPQVLRTRAAAHLLSDEYIAKFKEAIAKMKALPEDDPWNFYQQAQIHCQYCNGAYDQVGFPNVTLQVHNGWFFGPWHRFYLHFWEKILGKLIGDPTFAVPYWNWDTPDGMYMPDIYKDPSSPLYNKHRNPDHYLSIIDLKYKKGDPNPPTSQYKDIVIRNLKEIKDKVIETKGDPSLFLGGAVRAGDAQNVAGSLETLHNVLHAWVGPVEKPNWDMGNFHTSAREPLFWAHHANVDRIWHLYNGRSGRGADQPEFKDRDWLDSTFIFYDENRELVKCKVEDSLRIENFGYRYTDESLKWLSIGKKFKDLQKRAKKRSAGGDDSVTQVAEFGSKTRALDKTIRALVKRPKANLTLDDKEDVTEVLTVDDITDNDNTDQTRFDVYIAKPNEGLVSADLGEFVGSYFNIPHSSMSKMKKAKTLLRLGITGLVGEIGADSSENLVVSLVPRGGKVTIGGVKIDLVPNQIPDDDL